jgi:hypothetical protein
MKLLLSVFLTPDYITRYRTPALNKNSQSKYDRIDKFLTMVHSIAEINWESVDIYLSMDPKWKKFEPLIHDQLNTIFPNRILGERLSLVSQWRNATAEFSAKDIILLQANDDHALVPGSKNYLHEIGNIMSSENSIKMSAITHYPEFRGLLHRERKIAVPGRPNTIRVDNAIGTTLVKGDFLRSWFNSQNFSQEIKIVRPDNPFGKSVYFPPTEMLIPDREVMRHMDGYSHALLYRPLSPLRNTKLFSEESSLINDLQPWKIGLWPSAQFGYRGKGVDFYQQNHEANETFLNSIRIDIGNIVAANSLSINFQSFLSILNPKYSKNNLYKFFIFFIAVLNINVFRNIPDFIIQDNFPKTKGNLSKNPSLVNRRKSLIYNLGFFRGSIIFFTEKFWWLMPKNSNLTSTVLLRKMKKIVGE